MNKIQRVISAGLYTALLAACAVPQVDGTGRIAAGPRGDCPPGQVSRWGRCCPEESAISVCPVEATVPRVADGSLTCDDQGRCPNAHGYECRMGRVCCPSGEDGTGLCHPFALGRPCMAGMAQMCQPLRNQSPPMPAGGNAMRAAPRCLSTIRYGTDGPPLTGTVRIPGGYCSSTCRPGLINSCGDDGTCVDLGNTGRFDGDPLQNTGNDGFCLARCRVPQGHRPSDPLVTCRGEMGSAMSPFRCFPINAGDPQNTEGFCFPDCTVQDYCSPASTPLFRVICSPETRTCASPRM
jgi:hypothetical protein